MREGFTSASSALRRPLPFLPSTAGGLISGRAPETSTCAPGRRRSMPSTTMASPATTPSTIETRSPSAGPSFTGRAPTVLSGTHHVDEQALRAALHRRRGNHHHVAQRVELHAHVDELVGEEREVRVVELRLELDRAGRRIDLVVGRGERAVRQLHFLLAVPGLDRDALARLQPPHHRRHAVLRHGEHHRRGLQLRDHHQAVLRRRRARCCRDRPGAGRPGRPPARSPCYRKAAASRCRSGCGRCAPRPRTGAPATAACRPAASRSSPA